MHRLLTLILTAAALAAAAPAATAADTPAGRSSWSRTLAAAPAPAPSRSSWSRSSSPVATTAAKVWDHVTRRKAKARARTLARNKCDLENDYGPYGGGSFRDYVDEYGLTVSVLGRYVCHHTYWRSLHLGWRAGPFRWGDTPFGRRVALGYPAVWVKLVHCNAKGADARIHCPDWLEFSADGGVAWVKLSGGRLRRMNEPSWHLEPHWANDFDR